MKAPAKYRVGQMVYTYQSPTKRIRILECRHPNDHDYPYTYRMELENGRLSNWTNEESVSRTPIVKG